MGETLPGLEEVGVDQGAVCGGEGAGAERRAWPRRHVQSRDRLHAGLRLGHPHRLTLHVALLMRKEISLVTLKKSGK